MHSNRNVARVSNPCISGARVKNPCHRRGVGLVELLIALAISAALLTAVGAATDASFKAYAVNEEQSNLTQRARLTMERLNCYIRSCKAHAPVTPAKLTQFAGGAIVTDTGIAMFDDVGNQMDFVWNATSKQLTLKIGGKTRVLLRGVTAFSVKMEPMQSTAAIRSGSGFDLLKRASISLTMQTSGQSADIDESQNRQTITLATAVMPRRNSW